MEFPYCHLFPHIFFFFAFFHRSEKRKLKVESHYSSCLLFACLFLDCLQSVFLSKSKSPTPPAPPANCPCVSERPRRAKLIRRSFNIILLFFTLKCATSACVHARYDRDLRFCRRIHVCFDFLT